MELAYKVTVQVVIIFLLMSIGFIFARLKYLTEDGTKQLTNILLTLVTPCVLIEAYQQKDFNAGLLADLGFAFLLAVLVHIAAILISTLFFKVYKKNREVNTFSAVYSNCGFMAIPLLSAAMGTNGVFFGSAYLAVFTILSWTHGIFVMSGDKKQMSLKKILLNPGVIGTSIALALFFADIKLPSVLGQTVGYVADLNTPLAMIVIGTYFVNIRVKNLVKNLSMYICVVMRLIVIPLAATGICLLLPLDSEIAKSILIPAACPSAAISALFASRYGKDATYASETVAVSTLLSVFTIPLIILAASFAGI